MTREMRFWSSILVLVDVVGITTAWLLAYWIRFSSGWLELPEGNVVHPLDIYLVPVLLSLVILGWVFQVQESYHVRPRSWAKEMVAVLRGLTLAGPLVVASIYLLYRARYSRLVLLLFVPICLVILVAIRCAAKLVLVHWISSDSVGRRVVAVCGGDPSGDILREYLQYHPESRLVRTLELENTSHEQILRDKPDEVVIIFPQLQAAPLEGILKELESELIDVKFVPSWGGFRVVGYEVEKAGRLPLIHLRRSPLYGWGRIGKRSFDVIVSLAVLLVALPVMVPIAILIWLTSGRPVFYSQPRMGLDGKVFRMYKFRSMVLDADKNARTDWTQPDDPRRTPVGVWLRRFSLDELPQLVNILRGDMSFVGPRPEMAHLIEGFRKSIPHYYLRYKIKAGLTGWAQIHGLRGSTSLEQRIEFDLYYIEHWSLWLDLKILALTLIRAWSNAY